MKIYIYDIEVFAHDWFVVFSDIDEKEITVFHNDNVGLKRFMLRQGYFLAALITNIMTIG